MMIQVGNVLLTCTTLCKVFEIHEQLILDWLSEINPIASAASHRVSHHAV